MQQLLRLIVISFSWFSAIDTNREGVVVDGSL